MPDTAPLTKLAIATRVWFSPMEDKKKKGGLGKKLLLLLILAAVVVGGSKVAAGLTGNADLDLVAKILRLAGQ